MTHSRLIPRSPLDQQRDRLEREAGAQEAPRLVCGWCQKMISEGVEPVSHGCCEACAERLNAERAAA